MHFILELAKFFHSYFFHFSPPFAVHLPKLSEEEVMLKIFSEQK